MTKQEDLARRDRAARLATIAEAHHQWERAHAVDVPFNPEDNKGSGDYAVEHHQIEDDGAAHQALVDAVYAALGETPPSALTADATEDPNGEGEMPDLEGTGPQAAGIAVVANDTGRVLMLQRGLEDESDPAAGTWEFPGGQLEPGESPGDGGKREWEEEIGQKWPETATENPVHIWMSPDGVYQGLVHLIPNEKDIDLTANRAVQNPDDDYSEQAAWWDPDHAAANPALREECKETPWEALKNAPVQQQAQPTDGDPEEAEEETEGDDSAT